MNILICSPMQNEISFLHGRLEKFFVNHGTESVILSFPDVTFMMEYLLVSPDAPDAIFMSFPKIDTFTLDTVDQITARAPKTNIVSIGDAPCNVERLFSMRIFYFFYPDITPDRFKLLEYTMEKVWFTDREKYFILENKTNILRIAYSDILYVMSDKRKVIIYQPNGKVDSIYCKLDDIEKSLDERFIRCHQSYLINVQYIKGIEIDGFLTVDDIFIPISQKKYWSSKRKYIQYIKDQG